jgi:hypothetical protein
MPSWYILRAHFEPNCDTPTARSGCPRRAVFHFACAGTPTPSAPAGGPFRARRGELEATGGELD